MLGLGLLASATLVLSGCDKATTNGGTGTGGGGSSASPSPSPLAPKDAVLASTKMLTQTTYKYTISSDGMSGSGAADPAAKKTQMSVKGTQDGVNLSMDIVLVGTDLWLKMDLGGLNATVGIPNKYMHLQQSKLKDQANLGLFNTKDDTDPAESAKLLKGVVDAQKVDATHYKVTFDLTQTTSSAVDAAVLTKLGDKAKSVPGTVTLDSQGRLSEVTVDLSAVDPQATVKVTYSDYGAPVNVNPPPAADTVEAPQAVYDMFNK
jgi:hypothetical protein